MSFKSVAIAAAIAAPMLIAMPLQQASAQSVDIRIGTPPPPPRVVVRPAPRHGYVWVPGYWRWEGRRHVWADGHWIRARRGYHYVEPRWDHDRDRYRFNRGHWERG